VPSDRIIVDLSSVEVQMRLIAFSRSWSFLVLVLTCISCPSGSAEQKGELVVPIEDKSEVGSPVEVSGEVSFLETPMANRVSISRSAHVKVRNISEKPILLLVASLIDAGPRSSPEAFDLARDQFLKDKAIQPSEEVMLLQPPDGESHTAEPLKNPIAEGKPPKAEFRLQFVQFADGSSFGDSGAAKEYIDSRESKLSFLRTLEKAYREQGESGFLKALEQYPSAKGPALWDQVREQQSANGTEAAVVFVRHLISMGMQHEAGLQSFIATK